MKKLLQKFVSETEGQDLIEYALLASVIALGVTAAMMFLRDQLNTEFSNIGNSITAGSLLNVLDEASCGIGDPKGLLEALCKVSPEAFCGP